MRFIDANIFLRYLTRDDAEKAEAVKTLLERVERGDEEVFTIESVIVELVFVLSSPRVYKCERDKVRSLLLPLIVLPGLRLAKRAVMLRALDLYAGSNVDYVDALAVAHMEANRIEEVYSYDRHFEQFDGIGRVEP